MSILIKGMEMPTSCSECPCYSDEYFYCNARKSIDIRLDVRPSNCPLVPVPPHGRLIDAEWLKQLYDDPAYGEDMSRYHVAVPVILANIDDAPTIIEAEEGE